MSYAAAEKMQPPARRHEDLLKEEGGGRAEMVGLRSWGGERERRRKGGEGPNKMRHISA